MVFSGVVNLHVSLYVRKPPVQIFIPLPLVTSSVLMVIDNFDIYFAQGKEIFRTIYPNKNNWKGWRKTQRKNNKTQGIKKNIQVNQKKSNENLVQLPTRSFASSQIGSSWNLFPYRYEALWTSRGSVASKPRTSSLAYLFLFGQIVTRKRLGKSRFKKHFSGKFPWANGLNLFFLLLVYVLFKFSLVVFATKVVLSIWFNRLVPFWTAWWMDDTLNQMAKMSTSTLKLTPNISLQFTSLGFTVTSRCNINDFS